MTAVIYCENCAVYKHNSNKDVVCKWRLAMKTIILRKEALDQKSDDLAQTVAQKHS